QDEAVPQPLVEKIAKRARITTMRALPKLTLAGVLAICIGSRTALAQGLVLDVPEGNVLPLLDGKIEKKEWKDAAFYNLERFDAYFKHVLLKNPDGKPDCAIYPSNPSYTVPCDRYLLMAFKVENLGGVRVWFDEGDDGAYGSGSADRRLTVNQ